jgi:hypothetical protein
MNRFFTTIRDNLNNRPEPKFEENDWLALQEQLPQKPTRSFGAAAIWWLLPFVIISLGSNAFLFSELKSTKKMVTEIGFQKDTIYQSSVIYKTDTIYIINNIKQEKSAFDNISMAELLEIKRLINNENSNTASKKPLKTKTTITTKSNTRNENLLIENTTITNNENKNTTTLETQNTQTEDVFTIDFLKTQNSSILSTNYFDFPIVTKTNTRKISSLQNLKNMARPTGYRLGAFGGLVYGLDANKIHQTGVNSGIEAMLNFRNLINLFANCSYSKTFIEIEGISGNVGIPLVQPPSSDYELTKVNGSSPVVQYELGLNYEFPINKKIVPFLSLGYENAFYFPSSFTYTFENSQGIELEIESDVNSEIKTANFGLIKIGFHYPVYKKIHWQLQGGFHYNFNKNKDFMPSYSELKTGVFYQF